MAIKEKEYLFSVDKFNKPVVVEGYRAISLLLIRLLLLEPGSDPLHPDMGVGLRSYRFAMDKLEELKARVTQQINTYLPCYPATDVSIVLTQDHFYNIEITINDIIYVYDSATAPISLTLDNINE